MRALFNRRVAAVVIGVGMIAAPVAMASSASAAAGNAIVVSGTANASVDLVGGSGSFAFNATACAFAGASGAGLCTAAVTNGHFDNVVCGTGTAEGDVVVKNGSTVIYSGHFKITFAAGAGVYEGTGEAAHGVVQIAPVATATPPGCVTSFQVTASVVTGA